MVPKGLMGLDGLAEAVNVNWVFFFAFERKTKA
jgi:hypothetical protein